MPICILPLACAQASRSRFDGTTKAVGLQLEIGRHTHGEISGAIKSVIFLSKRDPDSQPTHGELGRRKS